MIKFLKSLFSFSSNDMITKHNDIMPAVLDIVNQNRKDTNRRQITYGIKPKIDFNLKPQVSENQTLCNVKKEEPIIVLNKDEFKRAISEFKSARTLIKKALMRINCNKLLGNVLYELDTTITKLERKLNDNI